MNTSETVEAAPGGKIFASDRSGDESTVDAAAATDRPTRCGVVLTLAAANTASITEAAAPGYAGVIGGEASGCGALIEAPCENVSSGSGRRLGVGDVIPPRAMIGLPAI